MKITVKDLRKIITEVANKLHITEEQSENSDFWWDKDALRRTVDDELIAWITPTGVAKKYLATTWSERSDPMNKLAAKKWCEEKAHERGYKIAK